MPRFKPHFNSKIFWIYLFQLACTKNIKNPNEKIKNKKIYTLQRQLEDTFLKFTLVLTPYNFTHVHKH